MRRTDRMASIAANLDDVQACAEASSRTVDILQQATASLNGRINAPLLRSFVARIKELQVCARDQRAALRELRTSIARLRDEMRLSAKGVRPPPASRVPVVQRGR